ncbi:aspartyl protease family protein [Sphingomonas sp.]|uniref:retropepsin-like aspartic protease n=1 Tax=Sphingomonas sp. TaxID=28214 RepID=UPI00286E099D|nr:aspartyl protease family protein [Sphingomonas sp.]
MVRKGAIFLISAVLAAAALAHAGHAPIAAAKPTYAADAARAAPFELFRGSRIIVEGTINGRATPMILDSGAGMTVVDSAYAERIGLKGGSALSVRGAAGNVPGKIAGGVTLTAGGLTLRDLNVLIIDLAPVARAIGREMPVILGRDAFKAGLVTIDFPKRTIAFAPRTGFTPPAGAARLALGDDAGLPSVTLAVAGGAPIEATLDLGNGGTLILAKNYWKDRPELANLRHAETQSGGVGGIKLARKVTLPRVDFAGMRLANVPAVLNEDAQSLPTSGGNLGIEMLKSFVVTIDDSGGAMYLAPGDGPPRFARERAGVRTEFAGDRLKVAYVSPDGPAAAAGLKAGDEIVAIDGRRIGKEYYSHAEWVRGDAGRAVALERADGSTVTVTLADYF